MCAVCVPAIPLLSCGWSGGGLLIVGGGGTAILAGGGIAAASVLETDMLFTHPYSSHTLTPHTSSLFIHPHKCTFPTTPT